MIDLHLSAFTPRWRFLYVVRFDGYFESEHSISRLIKEAVNQKYIKPFDPTTAPRYMKYVPTWA